MQQELREHIRIPGEFSASGHNPTLKEAHRVHSRSERKVRWMESCYLVCKPTRLQRGPFLVFFFLLSKKESMVLVVSVKGNHLSDGMSI